nr:hypothetical protein [Tanacetum cinerariifolium]
MDCQNWMYDISRSTPEYVKGVQTFLAFAETNRASSGARYIWCPCNDCKNVCKFNNTSVIEGHLIRRGFMHKYTCWSQHGELLIDKSTFVPVSNDHQDTSSYSNNNREDLSEMFHNLKRENLEIKFGKGIPLEKGIRKKSIFWELPYWKHLEVRNCLEVMHIEINVYDSLIGLLLNILGNTKDGVNIRKDMVQIGIRLELAPVENDRKRTYLPPACYTRSKAEKTQFCQCLHDIKVPSSYSKNIKRLVSVKDCKILGMKSHDCHVLMTHMIPIALLGLLLEHIRQTITKLCWFFNMIHLEVIDPEVLDLWQRDIILTLCELEMYFPPSFFDIMVHLVFHIVGEVKALGPVFLHQMYPFEDNGVLKIYLKGIDNIEISCSRHQADSDTAQRFATWMGVEVRARVSYLKASVHKNVLLRKMNEYHRKFKTNLTHITQEGKDPLLIYKDFNMDDWPAFVAIRNSPTFKEKSAKAREMHRRTQIDIQWDDQAMLSANNFTSLKGLTNSLYDQLKALLEKEQEMKADGTYYIAGNDPLTECFGPDHSGRTRSLLAKEQETKADGTYYVAGKDPLIECFGPEHSGRTRCVSNVVGKKKALGIFKRAGKKMKTITVEDFDGQKD